MRFLLVCEGVGDERDLRALTWKALRHAHDWLGGYESVEQVGVAWVDPQRGGAFEAEAAEPGRGERVMWWKDIDKICDRHRVPVGQRLGRGQGYQSTRRALNLLLALPDLDLNDGVRVILAHDTDHRPGWRESIEAARDEWLGEHQASGRGGDVDVAVGIAHPEHEAWVIAAFVPSNDDERERLEGLRGELGFDPTRKPERLTSGRQAHTKDAKRVLRKLIANNPTRRAGVLTDASLETLLAAGETTGLAGFLVELVVRIGPALGPVLPERVALLKRTGLLQR